MYALTYNEKINDAVAKAKQFLPQNFNKFINLF